MCKDKYMSKYRVHYISGLKSAHIAQVTYVHIEKDGLTLLNQKIKWADITNVELKHDTGANGFNAGGAIAGKLLFGTVGMLAGGLGGSKVDNYTVIEYSEPSKQLILKLIGAPAGQQKFVHLLTNYETNSKPKLSFAERTALSKQQNKEKLVANIARGKEQRSEHKAKLADLKVQAAERHERALERNARQKEQLHELGSKFKGMFRKAD
jgi:hypothetical protein